MKKIVNCPILKEISITSEFNITHIFKRCYKEYIECPIKECPRRLV